MCEGDMMSRVATVILLSSMLVSTSSQELFQFCGGRGLIHAVIKVCSRSLPDELAPPTERPTTPGTEYLTQIL